MNKKLLTCAALSALVMTSQASISAAECKIEGPMLMQAYSRAKNNGYKFRCYISERVGNRSRPKTKSGVTSHYQFLPTPNGLIC